MRISIQFLLLFLFASAAFAQTHKVSGTLIDAGDKSTIIGANVILEQAADSTQYKGAQTDTAGNFEFTDIADGNYRLKITYIGYNAFTQDVKVEGADKALGTLSLSTGAKQLGDVTVIEKQTRVEQKADTTEYNAKAYKTNPDATAEDLVTKMPGITNDNGTIKAQGEEVKKVTIDGKDFFGDDASSALKNLPAEVVDKVQVFDRMSDQAQFTGFDDGNSQKGMNITTKNGTNGVFGKVYGGYGYVTDHRYSAGFNINWFNKDRRVTVLGMSNNINQQNFSSQDLLGVLGNNTRGGPGGGGGRRPGGGGSFGGGSNNFMVGQQNGISTTHAAGLNYNDLWGKLKKVKISGSYFFNLADNNSNNLLNRQYFVTGDTSTYYNEANNMVSRNINHRVNLRLEYTIDTSNSLIITPRFSTQQNNKQNEIIGRSTTAENALISQTISKTGSDNIAYNFSTDLLFRHRFKKDRRTLSLTVTPTINIKTGTSSQLAENQYADDTSTLDQQGINSSDNYTIAGNITYTEPAGKTGMVQLSYDGSNAWNKSDKETFNRDSATDSYNRLDTLLSSKYDNRYMLHKGAVSYRFNSKKASFSVGVSGQYALLTGSNVFPQAYNTSRNFINVLPNAMFNYKFSTAANLRIYYRTSTTPPSISQMQDVIDNSNPLLLSTGNPDLKQSYNHFGMLRFGYSNAKTAKSFFAFTSLNYTLNNVGNSTFIASTDTVLNSGDTLAGNDVLLRAGSQLSKPVNIDGNMSINTFFTYAMPIAKIKSNINFNAGFGYQRSPSLINNAVNYSNTYNVNGGVVLSSNISEKIDFTISYSASYNIVKNTLQTGSDNNYFSHIAGARFNWMFWKGFVFNTNVQNTLYAGIAQGFNQNVVLWNASLGYKFLKDKSLEVKASVNDILNQNNGINRSVTDTYIEDSQNQVLKRYFMVTVTYTLKFMGGNKKGKGEDR